MSLGIATCRVGYVVFESPQFLVEWGVADVKRKSEGDTIDRICALLAWYFPDVLVLEDVNHASYEKGEHSRRLIKRTAEEAANRSIDVARVTQAEVRQCFGILGANNKSDRARLVAQSYPELLRALPDARKAWATEDYQIPMFDAAAFALLYFKAHE